MRIGRRSFSWIVCVVVAGWIIAAAVPARAASGDIHHLGTLGGPSSAGFAVNDAGQVAGESTIDNGPYHAFRYDGAGGVMRDLGHLGAGRSEGRAVNDAGQVAGSSNIILAGGLMPSRAFRYDGTPGAGGVMRDLGTLGGPNSFGFGINNAGQVTGSAQISAGVFHRAFLYDGTPGAGGVMHNLGTLGGTSSQGIAINNAGQVAGYSHNSIHTDRAFRYDGTPGAGGIMRDLGTLGGYRSFGWAINDAGLVAGYSEIIPGETATHAFLYIGTPGIDGQMIDLDSWLDAVNPTEGAKWTLTSANGLSNTGWITGAGTYDPDGPGGIEPADRAFLLNASTIVPEPATLLLAALAVGGFSTLRRGRAQYAGCTRFCGASHVSPRNLACRNAG